jgi:hypothetical protein
MAVPFVLDGLANDEPVLVTTTSRNLELLGEALGGDAGRVDHAETAYYGRRPAQRVTAFLRYWQRNSGRGRVRVLAEPVWQGRSARDVLAWKRMESSLGYAEPLAFIRGCDAEPLPGVPSDAVSTGITDLHDVRRFMAGEAPPPRPPRGAGLAAGGPPAGGHVIFPD